MTIPNRSTPPGEAPSEEYHGNGQMWTLLRPDGIVRIPAEDMAQATRDGIKWPWWRGENAEGQLAVEGSEWFGRSGSVTAIVPSGYGLSGFQATGMIFPGEGCWEIIGQSGDAELRFITRVEIIDK